VAALHALARDAAGRARVAAAIARYGIDGELASPWSR